MRDEADAGREEAGVVLRRRGSSREIALERAADGRDVDPDLLEHLALHHAAHAAAAGRAVILGAVPGDVVEARVRASLALDRLELGADAVAQAFEPVAGGLLLVVERGHSGKLSGLPQRFAKGDGGGDGKVEGAHSGADRDPDRKIAGVAQHGAGTPALSWPNSSMSSAANRRRRARSRPWSSAGCAGLTRSRLESVESAWRQISTSSM